MSEVAHHIACEHCGDECPDLEIKVDNHYFCCNGCKIVYSILHENGMGAYYTYEDRPGISQKSTRYKAYDFLSEPQIEDKLLSFRQGGKAKITLSLPQIHCSSCLWLLENIDRLEPGVVSSRVNFMRKEATILFDESQTTLRSLVETLARIGYEPHLNYDKLDGGSYKSTYSKKLLYQLGLAGFAFGNVMLLSFPEYLGFHKASLKMYVGYINIAIATPVLLYSGRDYLLSAFRSLKYRYSNIDVPVALGMITLFTRSLYEILSGTGEGYLDSFTGFVFFLLIGKWFQSFTYQVLDFDRNYKSYFPISATVKQGKEWITRSIDQLKTGDVILIKNQELIPADSTLLKGKANVDYSFVTGEADLISRSHGEEVLAGGKQMGNSIEVQVKKSVDQSYLTQLWNEDTFKQRDESSSSRMISSISAYFTYIILAIAVLTLVYWIRIDVGKAVNIFTAVLIVACPCALALAIPFTYGNILRILSRSGLYLRNVQTIENIQDVDHIIFDKTGTITDNSEMKMTYEGRPLTQEQKVLIKSSCVHSSHPLSKAIVQYLDDTHIIEIDEYQDEIGKGFKSASQGKKLKLGSAQYIFDAQNNSKRQGVFIEIDGEYLGYFQFRHSFRKGIRRFVDNLHNKHYGLSVLSGDTDKEMARMEDLFPDGTEIRFNQSPKDKLAYIQQLQDDGKTVMMIGDGLNDAGALKQSQVGIVISDKINNFSPACDGMQSAESFPQFYNYFRYLNTAKKIIWGAFILAFLYNTIGLSFAVTGRLSPVVAAILMPLSSITVIVYGVVSSVLAARYYKIKPL